MYLKTLAGLLLHWDYKGREQLRGEGGASSALG
jgi:hypothetical protein